MLKTKPVKITTDILMYADFIFLMSHSNVRNLGLHAWTGIALFVLFIVHHLLNMWFYKITFKGKFNAKRILLNVTDWILFVLMLLMAISSVFASGAVFEWSPLHFNQLWRTIHLMSTSWGFMVMSFHLSLHLKLEIPKQVRNDRIPKQVRSDRIPKQVRDDKILKQVRDDKILKQVRDDGILEQVRDDKKNHHHNLVSVTDSIMYAILILAGCFAFYKSQIYVYLCNIGNWKMAAPNLIVSVLEYIGITAGICAGVQVFRNIRRTK